MALMQQAKVAELHHVERRHLCRLGRRDRLDGGRQGRLRLVPQGKGGKIGQVEGWTYLIPAYTKNPQAAFLFIQWMMGYDRQLEQHLDGGASGRPDVYASPEVQKLPYAQASMASNEYGKPKATLPQSSEMTDILVRELSSFLAGEKTSKAALDAAATDISALLGSCAPMTYPAR